MSNKSVADTHTHTGAIVISSATAELKKETLQQDSTYKNYFNILLINPCTFQYKSVLTDTVTGFDYGNKYKRHGLQCYTRSGHNEIYTNCKTGQHCYLSKFLHTTSVSVGYASGIKSLNHTLPKILSIVVILW